MHPDLSDHTDPDARTRTYTWPARPESDGRNNVYAGLEAMQRVVSGQTPLSPGAATLGVTLTAVAPGRATMTATPGDWAVNVGGTVHGGIVSGWVDSALGYSTATVLEPGTGYSTLDLTVRYIAAMHLEHTPATIEAEVEHAGRSTAVVRVLVHDTRGRLCASASGVMMLFRI